MEIKYEKFNQLDAGYAILNKIFTPRISSLAVWEDETGNYFKDFSNHEKQLWHAQANEIDVFYNDDLFDFDVRQEIEANLVSIESDGQVKRYLEYIKSKLIITQELVFSLLDYHKLNQQKYKMLVYETFKNGETDNNTLAIRSPITDLRISYLRVASGLTDIMECIEEHLSPVKSNHFKVDLDKNTHKLLLMHKTGVFEAMYKKYHQHLGAVKFSRLIATMIGVEPEKQEGFRPSVNELIKEILIPTIKKTIQTNSAENKVNSFLAEIGIDV